MKTLKNITVAFALFLSIFSLSFAKGGVEVTIDNCTATELMEKINKEVEFPELVEDYGYTGSVEVVFDINEENKIEILYVEGSSEVLSIHVEETLEGMKVSQAADSDCGFYTTTIEFVK